MADANGVTPTIGLGTKLEYQQTSVSNSWVEIKDVLDLEPPDIDQKNAVYRPLRGTNYAQKNSATLDLGDFKFKCIWTAALFTAFVGMLLDNTVKFRVTDSNGSNSETFNVLCKKQARVIKVDEDKVIDFTGEAWEAITIV
jgi:hypothetical protein